MNLLNVISIIAMIVPLQLNGQPSPNEYHNLYGDYREWDLIDTLRNLSVNIEELLHQTLLYSDQEIPDTTPHFGTEYDFVVVGAGTAGASIAARLSENPQVKVLLIEAGSHETFLMDIRLFEKIPQLSNKINWKYQIKPSNKYYLGMKDNRRNYHSGKVMGGTSVLNYMVATRGSAEDYNRWAKMGNEGWAYKDVLKYFKKLETMNIPELQADTIYHGTKGPVHITQNEFHTPIAEAYLEAGKQLGYPIVDDYNGKNIIGFSYIQNTMRNGSRMSSNRAYLHPSRNRKNLHVTMNSTVRKVLINRCTNEAIGVEFIKHDRIISVFARKEVIVCAGAIGSPKLLMLSGIGPAKHLTDLGIDVIQDAPVGENLMDHANFQLSYQIDPPIKIRAIDVINPRFYYIEDFLTKLLGPFDTIQRDEVFGFINTKNPEQRSGLPDIELIYNDGSFQREFSTTTELSELYNQLPHVSDRYIIHGWTLLTILLKPKSRGWLRLVTNDVNVKPEIVPNYFDDSEDVRTMIAGIRTAIRISRTKALQTLGSRLLNITAPGCKNYEYDSDAYWECMITTLTTTGFHFCGTCKMGPRGDPTAVVDPKLKVIGVRRLRVADASIMPEIISAHLNIPVFMIAEKVADMIKEEWELKSES